MKIKKLIVTISVACAMLMMVNNVNAQKKYVNKAMTWAQSGEKLDTALGAINYAENQEKTKDWAKTYYAKGLIYEAIAKSKNDNFKKLSEHPLVEAFDNYKKAYNMNGSGMYQNLMDMRFIDIANQLVNEGVNEYKAEDYKDAFLYFQKSLEVKQMKVFAGEIDTAVIFNAAIAAQRIKDYDDAIKYYKKAIEYNYAEGEGYRYLADCYKQSGDTTMYINTLKDGFEKYSSNQGILGTIINYYLLEKENVDEAFKYLAVAREKDPNNAQFYNAEAHLYDKIGKQDEAIRQYNKAIELDPKSFEAYYNLGVIYFNQGVALTDKANEITDNAKYQVAKEEADAKFKEALPYIEKSHELKPGDQGIMSTLKTLYYRLKMKDKYDAINAEMGN